MQDAAWQDAGDLKAKLGPKVREVEHACPKQRASAAVRDECADAFARSRRHGWRPQRCHSARWVRRWCSLPAVGGQPAGCSAARSVVTMVLLSAKLSAAAAHVANSPAHTSGARWRSRGGGRLAQRRPPSSTAQGHAQGSTLLSSAAAVNIVVFSLPVRAGIIYGASHCRGPQPPSSSWGLQASSCASLARLGPHARHLLPPLPRPAPAQATSPPARCTRSRASSAAWARPTPTTPRWCAARAGWPTLCGGLGAQGRQHWPPAPNDAHASPPCAAAAPRHRASRSSSGR